jgi:uncharacterized protein YcfJ
MKEEAKKTIKISLITCVCLIMFMSGGCGNPTTNGKPVAGKSALLGAGLGALAGQAIGGDTKATLVGAGIGAGLGYVIGNEKDKKAAQTHDYTQATPLTGTKWKIVSLSMEDKPEYERVTVEFRPDGKVVTTRYEPGGTKTITEERYRVVGKTLIIHKTDYIINAEYQIYGNELIVTCERFRAVLQRI